MATTRFLDRDRGYRRLTQTLKRANRSLTVGIHSDAGRHPDTPGETVAEVGAAHEFGAGVPERSFLRSTFLSKSNEYNRLADREIGKAIDKGQSIDRALGRLGLKMESDVRETIRTRNTKAIDSNDEQELSQVTIDRKGSNVPLINHNHLVNSIAHKVG